MKNVSIKKKIAAVVAFLCLLLALVGLVGLLSLKASNAAMKSMYDDRLVALGQLDTVVRNLNVTQLVLTRTLITSKADHAAALKRVEHGIENASKTWAAYMATYLTPDEKRLADQTAAARKEFLEKGVRPAIESVQAGDMEQLKDAINGPMTMYFQPVRDGVDQLIQLQLDVAQQEYERSMQRYNWILLLCTAGIAAGLLLGTLAGWWLIRSISTPLADAVRFAQGIANGDLAQTLQVRSNDETGQLSRSLKDMNLSLAKIVGEVRSGAHTIATASSEIATGNMDLSSRTEEQASSLEETASVMEELTTTVKQNAENARQANQMAVAASAAAAKGGLAVTDVVNTMTDINSSARQMADIISVIDGIAFQTNILALNAAVEAARAGEQGRGFAVVATEVRNLAQRSATAAKEIKQLIATSVEKVETGSELVQRTKAAMGEVVERIKLLADIMGEISSASEEQSAGIEEVNKAIAQMDQVTQQNASLVEEAAAAAESLKDQATQLARSASVFKLSDQKQELQPAAADRHLPPGIAMRAAPGKAIDASRRTVRAPAAAAEEWVAF